MGTHRRSDEGGVVLQEVWPTTVVEKSRMAALRCTMTSREKQPCAPGSFFSRWNLAQLQTSSAGATTQTAVFLAPQTARCCERTSAAVIMRSSKLSSFAAIAIAALGSLSILQARLIPTLHQILPSCSSSEVPALASRLLSIVFLLACHEMSR